MTKIEREKRVVLRMIELYCKHRLGLEGVNEEYRQLGEYACRRLEHCRFGEKKTSCKRCPIHCYAPQMRKKICAVMRWMGPRMLLYDPMAALRHMLGL